MKIAIIQPNYFPWPAYYSIIGTVDAFVIYNDAQYTKQDWRNRCLVRCNEMPKWLTLPVKKNQALKTTISRTEICTSREWQKDHISKLKNYYRLAPYLEEGLFFFRSTTDYAQDKILGSVLVSTIIKTCDFLGIKTPLYLSSEMNLQGSKNEKLVQICNKLGADTYISGPSAKSYIDIDFFIKNEINVEWINYDSFLKMSCQKGFSRSSYSIIDWFMLHGASTSGLISKIQLL